MEHISTTLDKVMVNFMVRCMLNPDNHDFYLPELTLDKINKFFKGLEDTSVSEVFWKAYGIAQTHFLDNPVEEVEFKQLSMFDEITEDTCPECGCHNFVPGVRCPNCDYVD